MSSGTLAGLYGSVKLPTSSRLTTASAIYLCDHPGALQGDHVIQYAEDGTDDISNIRPAHGSAGKQKNPCPVCGLNCNNVRGALSVEAGRRKIARRLEKMDITSEVNEPFDW